MNRCVDCQKPVPRNLNDQIAELWGKNRNGTWRCRACQDALNEQSAQRFAEALHATVPAETDVEERSAP